jgi:hypothetical protein
MKGIRILPVVGALVLILFLALTPVAAVASPGGVQHNVAPGTNEQNWKDHPAGMGYLDFEAKSDGDILGTELPGLKFVTTQGQEWLVGAWSAGTYNGKYPSGQYTSEGDKWAWLGVSQGSGIIEFTEGTARYVSVYASTFSGLVMDAYDKDDNLIDSSGWATSNTGTGAMDRLWVESAAKNIKYVIIHDTGNYFLIDSLVADAPGVGANYWFEDPRIHTKMFINTKEKSFEFTTPCGYDSGLITNACWVQLGSNIYIKWSATNTTGYFNINTSSDYCSGQVKIVKGCWTKIYTIKDPWGFE